MAAAYTTRDERHEEIRKALEEHANVRDAPTLFRCNVRGVEMCFSIRAAVSLLR